MESVFFQLGTSDPLRVRRQILSLVVPVLLMVLCASCAKPVAGPGTTADKSRMEEMLPQEQSSASVQQAGPSTKGLAPGSILRADASPLFDSLLTSMAAGQDYVLVGESHTSQCDHDTQAHVLDVLGRAGVQANVGLEMVSVDFQPVLDRFNSGELSADELEGELNWAETWGYPFVLYEPIFKVAEQYRYPLKALNVPRAAVRMVSANATLYREQGPVFLSDDLRAMVPQHVILPPEEQLAVLRDSFSMHDGDDDNATAKAQNEAAFQRFITVQSLWDTAMAANAREARLAFGTPVVIIAGSGHVDYNWGIAHRLAILDPQARILNMMPWRGGSELEGADAYFYCPPTHRSSRGMTLQAQGDKVVVTDVLPDSRAEQVGLKPGDIVTSVSGHPVSALSDLHRAGMAVHKSGESMVFHVLRNGQEVLIDFGPLKTRRQKDQED